MPAGAGRRVKRRHGRGDGPGRCGGGGGSLWRRGRASAGWGMPTCVPRRERSRGSRRGSGMLPGRCGGRRPAGRRRAQNGLTSCDRCARNRIERGGARSNTTPFVAPREGRCSRDCAEHNYAPAPAPRLTVPRDGRPAPRHRLLVAPRGGGAAAAAAAARPGMRRGWCRRRASAARPRRRPGRWAQQQAPSSQRQARGPPACSPPLHPLPRPQRCSARRCCRARWSCWAAMRAGRCCGAPPPPRAMPRATAASSAAASARRTAPGASSRRAGQSRATTGRRRAAARTTAASTTTSTPRSRWRPRAAQVRGGGTCSRAAARPCSGPHRLIGPTHAPARAQGAGGGCSSSGWAAR